jgi:hypothetical protein
MLVKDAMSTQITVTVHFIAAPQPGTLTLDVWRGS